MKGKIFFKSTSFKCALIILINILLFIPAKADVFPEKEWICRVKPGVLKSTLLVTNDLIIAESTDHVLFFIDKNTGFRKWMFRFGNDIEAFNIVGNDYIAVLSGDVLNILDISHQRINWSGKLQPSDKELLLNPNNNKFTALMLSDNSLSEFKTVAKDTDPVNTKVGQPQLVELEKIDGIPMFANTAPNGTLSIEDRRASFTPSDASTKGWDYNADQMLAKTALYLKQRLFLVTVNGDLLVLFPENGTLSQKFNLTSMIDMRFWDEKPENINNFSDASLFTDSSFLYIVAASSITKLKLNSFPKEISASSSKDNSNEESTSNWALNRAIKQWDQKNYASSVQMLRDVVNVWPDYSTGRLFLGMAYSSAGKIDDAINELEKAHDIDPENPDISSNLTGNYYLKIFTLDPAQQTDKIIELYTKIRILQPTDVFSYTGQAEIYLGRREYESAIGVLNELANHTFVGPTGPALLLSAYYMEDNSEYTIKQADNIIRLFPGLKAAYAIKGKELCKQGKYIEATKVFQSSLSNATNYGISLYPQLLSAGWEFFYGNALGLSGSYQDGINILVKFIHSLPDKSELEAVRLHEQKIIEQSKSGGNIEISDDIPQRLKGISFAELNTEIEFKIPALLSIAHFQYRLGKSAESVKTIKQIQALKPVDQDTLSYLGYLLVLNNKDLQTARTYIMESLKSNPNDPIYLRNYAVYLAAVKKYQLSESTFNKAISLGNSTELLHYEYGVLLLAMKRKKEAVEQFKTELSITPDLEMAKKMLSQTGSK